MRPRGSFVRALPLALCLLAAVFAGPAFGQGSPASTASPPVSSPSVAEKGICAPWHHCVAYGTIGVSGLALLALLAGYAFQSRGFDKLEHRQGAPQGVAVKKE